MSDLADKIDRLHVFRKFLEERVDLSIETSDDELYVIAKMALEYLGKDLKEAKVLASIQERQDRL